MRRALTVFHGVMQTFEARIASARQALENRQPGIGQTFTLDAPLWAQESLWRREQAKPEHQIAKLQARLEEARLIATTPEPCSVNDLFERWKTERKPSILTTNEYERSKDAFVKLNGDLPIAEYNTTHARAWKDHVLKMTDRRGNPLAHATLVKNFGAISTLFGLAERNELLTLNNPFDKIEARGMGRRRTEQAVQVARVLEAETPPGGRWRGSLLATSARPVSRLPGRRTRPARQGRCHSALRYLVLEDQPFVRG